MVEREVTVQSLARELWVVVYRSRGLWWWVAVIAMGGGFTQSFHFPQTGSHVSLEECMTVNRIVY